MTKTQKPEPNTRPQRERFIEAAQQAGAEDDEATFRAKLGVIARQKPKQD